MQSYRGTCKALIRNMRYQRVIRDKAGLSLNRKLFREVWHKRHRG